MGNFTIAFQLTAAAEGGYVNKPSTDKGGETYMGVSRVANPNWVGWAYIDAIKKMRTIKNGEIIDDPILQGMVIEFYKQQYWDVNQLDHIQNQEIANELYDTGVNMGVSVAALMLQQALNLLNRNNKDYADIAEDGCIGNNTILTANACKYQKALLKTLNGLQFSRYVEICRHDKNQENNFIGWLNRVQ